MTHLHRHERHAAVTCPALAFDDPARSLHGEDVTREQRPGNRKNVYVALTPHGRALKEKLVPLAEEVNRLGVAGLDPAHVATARKVLMEIIANLARESLAPPPAGPPRRRQIRGRGPTATSPDR